MDVLEITFSEATNYPLKSNQIYNEKNHGRNTSHFFNKKLIPFHLIWISLSYLLKKNSLLPSSL